MKSGSSPQFEIVTDSAGLQEVAGRLAGAKAIAVDVEADSMYHFKERVCLIQMAADGVHVVIDPLQLRDLSVLKPIFKDNGCQKVFHGADYDVRCLYRDFGIVINNLFDTQIACRFLGVAETGLEAVLKKRYDVVLNKKYQRKDWSRRPLPAEMIRYASEDVRYLITLAKALTVELEQKGRLSWVIEECRHLSKVRPASPDGGPLFLHFKGAGRLDPRSLAVLEALLQYRRDVACKKDRPLFRIIGNAALAKLAAVKPLSLKNLEKSRALSPKQISMYGRPVVAAVKKAVEIPPEALPVYPRKKAPRVPAAVGKRVNALKIWRDQRATALGMDPALVCTNALISAIALLNPMNLSDLSRVKGLKNWQKKTWGREIVNVLRQTR